MRARNNEAGIDEGLKVIARLIEIARRDTGQSRKVADFLLAWHNATENGGWDITDLWSVDEQIAADMLTVLEYVASNPGKYPSDIGFEREIEIIWRLWRGER
ncbi:MAG TPA: hypothetical protein VG273_27815 [Bryobacteraceae bacterium]|nr:hypothetical protein [Bryobacteraceae bacterium]